MINHGDIMKILLGICNRLNGETQFFLCHGTPMTPMTTGCQLRFLLAAICLICYCAPTYRKAFRRLGTAPGSTLC